MDIGKAFGQMFKDPKWATKMLWFALFCFLCMFLIGVPFVSGYTILVLQNYMSGSELLPEWEGNWEKILMTGLKYFVLTIVVAVVMMIVSFMPSMLFGFMEALLKEMELNAISLLFSLLSMCFSFVLNFAVTLVTYATMIRFAKNGSFSEVFEFDWYVDFLKKSWQNLLLAMVLGIVVGIIVMFGLAGCVIGVFLTAFYGMVTNMAILAEVAKAAGETAGTVAKSAEPQFTAPTVVS